MTATSELYKNTRICVARYFHVRNYPTQIIALHFSFARCPVDVILIKAVVSGLRIAVWGRSLGDSESLLVHKVSQDKVKSSFVVQVSTVLALILPLLIIPQRSSSRRRNSTGTDPRPETVCQIHVVTPKAAPRRKNVAATYPRTR